MKDKATTRFLRDVDHYSVMTDILMVTDATDEELSELYAEVTRLSNVADHSTADLLDAAEEFGKKGFEIDDLSGVTETAVHFARMENVSLDEAVRVVSVVLELDGRSLEYNTP